MNETLTIDHVGARGDGVATHNGQSVFVPYTLPGEQVEARCIDGYNERRQLVRVIQPSAERITPFCKYFGQCGGCAIQHWQPHPYLAWKRTLVVDALRHAGIEADVAETIDAHGSGRRRFVAHARRGADGEVRVGFTAPNTHAVVALDNCPILDPALSGALDACRAIADLLKPNQKPLDLHVTAADNGLDVDVRGSGPVSPSITSALARVAAAHDLIRLTRHGELVTMRAQPMLAIGKSRVPLPPAAFLQATSAGETALAGLVSDSFKGAKTIADLFCGVGPFALRLAEQARVFAFDNDAGAIAALQTAARAPGLKPVVAATRDLFRRPLAAAELRDFNAVVFDPPRQGAEAQARHLALSGPSVVVAVSCNVATFARDARILIAGDYRIEMVTPVDQFRHTAHVEIVAKFSR